jgi:uncharacterized membrane protein YraQ (UPF0718 family)
MIKELFLAGLIALKDYIATHVLTCLVPAFLLAGGIVTFINREEILEILGEKAKKIKSFTLASLSSFFSRCLLLHCYSCLQWTLLCRSWSGSCIYNFMGCSSI